MWLNLERQPHLQTLLRSHSASSLNKLKPTSLNESCESKGWRKGRAEGFSIP